MLNKGLCFVLVYFIINLVHAAQEQTICLNRLQDILQDNVKSTDVSSLYYSIEGLKLLNKKLPTDVCEVIKNTKIDLKNIEQVFYLTNAASLSGCSNALKPEVLSAATAVLDKKDVTIPELYYAVFSLKALGKGTVYDKEDGLKNLIQLLKKDDSAINYGYVFSLCEHMGCQAWTVSHAEGVILSAEESDGKQLRFEGGLPATSIVLSSIIRTFNYLKKPVPLSLDQRYKLAEYLSSRRGVGTSRGAALLLKPALLLSDIQPSLIYIGSDKKFVVPEEDSVEISVTDLIGRPIESLKNQKVIVQSMTRLVDDVVVLSKQTLTNKPGESTKYILNLSSIKSQYQYGWYKLAVTAGDKSSNLNVAVLGEIQVESLEIGVGDIDGTTSPKLTTVNYPNKLAEKLQADHLQKVTLKFTVLDKSKQPVLVQQAFVRVASVDNDNEIIYVAEPDNAKTYKVELSVRGICDFTGVAGAHSLTLLVGDSAAASPASWPLASLQLSSPLKERKEARRAGAPLPPVSHSFREESSRPPRVVSDAFAALSLAPLLLLLLLWARLGLSLRLRLSLWTLLFHAALGACLALYGWVWMGLSMFACLRYLLPLAAITALSGHRALRGLASDKLAQLR